MILNEAQACKFGSPDFSLIFQSLKVKHLFMALLDFKSNNKQNLKIRVITWNQARKPQTSKPEQLVRDIKDLDIVVFGTQECETLKKASRAKELEDFMNKHNFENIEA